MFQLKDKAKTRVVISAITSYAPDYDINYSNNSKNDTIVMSIGSAVIKLIYADTATRDSDLEVLDKECGL